MALPSIVCLQSVHNKRFLRVRTDEAITNGLLQFSGETVKDTVAQFEVCPADVGDGRVHIKSRYTNKYLVRWSPKSEWITASADKPNEDDRDWGCTLFKPTFVGSDTTKVILMHEQLRQYACLSRSDPPFDLCLVAGPPDIDSRSSCDIFTVIDWTSILQLPKNVAFQGDNGKFLGPYQAGGNSHLRFMYDNPNDPHVAHEIIPSSNGTIMIKSNSYGKFWRLGDNNWIVADVVSPSSSNVNAMFRANMVNIDTVALLNMAKILYCKRYTISEQKSFFSAITPVVDEYALLHVRDLDSSS